MNKLFAVILALVCGLAQAQVAQIQPFMPTGNTVTFTANTSGSLPTPVKASTPAGSNTQYVITNIGANTAFISYAGDSATATANCVIPTGTSTPVIPVLSQTQIAVTTFANSFFCGITASGTSVIYVTPGIGQ